MLIYLLDVWIDCVLLSYGQCASGMKAIKMLNLCHGEDRLYAFILLFTGKMRSVCFLDRPS